MSNSSTQAARGDAVMKVPGRMILLLANPSDDATYTRGAGAAPGKAIGGMRLLAGDVISAGPAGSVFFQVDGDKLFELEPKASAAIAADGSALAMTATKGNLYACRANPLGGGSTSAGTTTMNVRG